MNKRIWLCLVLVAALLGGAVGACAQTETGTAQGFGGEVRVTLTVEDGVITAASASGENETLNIGSAAVEQLPGKMMEHNSVAVDGVAGATITSGALLSAAQSALTAMGLAPSDLKATDSQAEAAPAEPVTADVVVVGGGGAGIAAAMAARAVSSSPVPSR